MKMRKAGAVHEGFGQIDSSSRVAMPIAETGECAQPGRLWKGWAPQELRILIRVLAPTDSYSHWSYSHPFLLPPALAPTNFPGGGKFKLWTRYRMARHSSLFTFPAISRAGKLIHPLAWQCR